MSLTISNQMRCGVGNRQMRMVEITFDGTVDSVTAEDLDLNYIEAVVPGMPFITSDVADSSTLLQYLNISVLSKIGEGRDALAWSTAPSPAGSKQTLLVIGW